MPQLTWLTREDDIRAAARVPYRLLEEVPDLGAGDRDTGNMLIQGDNLDALKALLPFYAGRVKCIYIDPPFNTGQAFEHYDDNFEHSIWLGAMYARFELLHDLLATSGTMAVHLDDEELSYCIDLLDEIFGRNNRVNIVTFRQGSAVGHKAINPGLVTVTNYIIIYAKDKNSDWMPNKIFTARDRDKRYSNFIENYDDHFSLWRLISLARAFADSLGVAQIEAKKTLGERYDDAIDEFVIRNAHRVVQPVPPAYDAVGQATRNLIDESKSNEGAVFLQKRDGHPDIYLKNGKRWLFYKDKLKDIDGKIVSGEPLTNLWDDILSNNLHNEGDVKFPKGKKPEALVKRIFDIFSGKDDLVLDSFLGSGTTAAVAHKMGRRYIGVEMGDHAVTHCAPRLRKVIDGEQGGISEAVGWKGGGGFRFFRLGPAVFAPDGRIAEGIPFATLAAHVWFGETRVPWNRRDGSPVLGLHGGAAFALLYNGVLGDKRPNGGNVLTVAVLRLLRAELRALDPTFAGPVTVYGESSRLGPARLKAEGVTFKQTPRDLKTR